MPDLITISRAAQNPTLASLNATNPAYLASLVTAASDSIRRECGREFILAAFTEYHSGGIYIREPLRLRQYPVAEITRRGRESAGGAADSECRSGYQPAGDV